MAQSTTVTGTAVDAVPGSLSERAADRLAALTGQAADVPTVVLSLVHGDRLDMIGGFGVPSSWRSISDVPMSGTLSGLVLSTGFPVVMEDVTLDRRLAEHAGLRRSGTRAYLGFPIHGQDDEPVGVCAAVDFRPRIWTADEMRAVDHAAQACTALVAKQRARQEIDRQRRFLDAILESLHVGVAACDPSGRITLFNAALRRLIGDQRPGADAAGWARQLILRHPDGSPLAADEVPLLRALHGDPVRDVELLVFGSDGRRRLLLVNSQAIAGPDGGQLGAVATLQDITSRRRTERFRTGELAVATALAEAATIQDAGPRVLAAVAGTLGWPHAELWLVDEHLPVLRPAARWSAPGMALPVPDGLRRGEGVAGTAWQRGTPVWVSDLAHHPRIRAALAIPVRSGEDTIGVLAVFADTVEDPEGGLVALLSGIAAHIGQYLERRRAERLERELSRSKDDYLALIGHELRTPLTSISAGVELLRDLTQETLVTQGPGLLEIVERNTVALRRVIDDLLDLAALDSGHATVRPQDFDLAETVRDALAQVAPTATAANLGLATDLPPRLAVEGDRKRLRQVVDHLLDNSLKYTPDGGRISVELTTDGQVAHLRVCDTGIGIPSEAREQLFTHLYRSPYARDRRIPGSGLGLVISRAIVERHGGTIVLEATEDPGTCILVRLPMRFGGTGAG